ncbi:ankyrin repeat domain-containing protein 13C-A-like [Canna indica]|uniref:Ankyrin repeat domain-containing protein 13C-A-like n=1 Tax=Canna indica TaxID=4628 RepID=A0AAQ3QCU1_9LILI|nr:ankyrin repeat domain-containing protein 13C-A-like [Canna indica]
MAPAIDPSKYEHSPVHKAVLARDYPALKSILAELPRLSELSSIRTEADSAAEEKADAISAVVDRRDVPNRETSLYLVARLDYAVAVEMLMAAGADWTLKNEQRWSAFQEAVFSGRRNLARIIVLHNNNTDRIAPSDTYKIWKWGCNLRADMTMVGFDGFRIQRSDQSVRFLGDGTADSKLERGSFYIISHKRKEVVYTSDKKETPPTDQPPPSEEPTGEAPPTQPPPAKAPPTEADIDKEIASMSEFSFRPRLNVTRANILPQVTWTWKWRDPKWSGRGNPRPPPRAVAAKSKDSPPLSNESDTTDSDEFEDALTEDLKQLETALETESPDTNDQIVEADDCSSSGCKITEHKQDRKKKKSKKAVPPRSSQCAEEKLNGDSQCRLESASSRHSIDFTSREEDPLTEKKGLPPRSCSSAPNSDSECKSKPRARESGEFKKFLRPILWLSPDFPLGTEELLPLLDILAHKVKAIRRLRELLTTKLPSGSFPVKASASSWSQWIKAPIRQMSAGSSGCTEDVQIPDPFLIPPDYTWTTFDKMVERNKKKQERKNKAKMAKHQSQ